MAKGIALGTVHFTNHFVKQARAKGFGADQIAACLANPDKVTRVSNHEGQMRYCGFGVAIVMADTTAITIYADGIVTPMREDQRDDPRAISSRRLSRATM